MREVVSAKEAPRGVGNQRILLSVFHSSGKVFFPKPRPKLAERALSISEQIISARPQGAQRNLMTPGQSKPEVLSRGFPKYILSGTKAICFSPGLLISL